MNAANREPEPQEPTIEAGSPADSTSPGGVPGGASNSGTSNTGASNGTKRSRRAKARMVAGATLAGLATLGNVSLAGGRAGAIVSGTSTPIEQAPWQVSLRAPDGHFCGGSIVDPRVIATAAHCTAGARPAEMEVRAGVTRHEDAGGQDRKVSRIIEHPDDGKGTADIALVVLAEPLQIGPKVQTIGLATEADVAGARTARVSGWGTTSETGEELPAELQSAEVPLIDDRTCSRDVKQQGEGEQVDVMRELCAEGAGKGSCYGDSGGPLVVTGADGSPKLAGVVSWGIECGKGPGMYAEVPAFEAWLHQGIESALSGSAHPAGPDRLPVDQYDEKPSADGDGGGDDEGAWEPGEEDMPGLEALLDLGDLLSQEDLLSEDEAQILAEAWRPLDLSEVFAGSGSVMDR